MSLSIPRRRLGVTDGQLHSFLNSVVVGELKLHATVALRPEKTYVRFELVYLREADRILMIWRREKHLTIV